jgi:hypothetical protein
MRPTRAVPALAVLVLLLVCAPADAQVLLGYLFGEKLASPTFNMGFEVGANFTNLDGFPDAQRSNRPVFGLFADWRFSEHFHFGAAVLPIASRGANVLGPVLTGDPDFDAQTASGTMNRNLNYLEIPLAGRNRLRARARHRWTAVRSSSCLSPCAIPTASPT